MTQRVTSIGGSRSATCMCQYAYLSCWRFVECGMSYISKGFIKGITIRRRLHKHIYCTFSLHVHMYTYTYYMTYHHHSSFIIHHSSFIIHVLLGSANAQRVSQLAKGVLSLPGHRALSRPEYVPVFPASSKAWPVQAASEQL